MNIQNLFDKGYTTFVDPSSFVYLQDIESYNWMNKETEGALRLVVRSPEINSNISNTQKLIGKKYIHQIDPNYELGNNCEIVDGMDDATLEWHNDEIEGYQLAVLLYWDQLDSDTGGNIEFRYSHTKDVTGGFYPSKYLISIMNHGPKFEHIVRPMRIPVPRRVALFNYIVNVPWI